VVSVIEVHVTRQKIHHHRICNLIIGSGVEVGNSLDQLRHPRSDAYSAEQVLLNKQQFSGGGAYPDCCLEVHAVQISSATPDLLLIQ